MCSMYCNQLSKWASTTITNQNIGTTTRRTISKVGITKSRWNEARIDEDGDNGPHVSATTTYSHRGQRQKHTSVEEQVERQGMTNQEGEGAARQDEQRPGEAAPGEGDDQRPQEIITPRRDNVNERDCAEQERESARPPTCDTGTTMT